MYFTLNIVNQSLAAGDLSWWAVVFSDELQLWACNNCNFSHQYRDFFHKSNIHDMNVSCGKTDEIGCCLLRDMLLLLFPHSFKFR